ncbi:MAG TPA: cupredoxin family copper-binding protein [Acidimicrobiia bacterium]|nr:cupredoxin family copper-binding protein [Acidimicrobiia bacterium]
MTQRPTPRKVRFLLAAALSGVLFLGQLPAAEAAAVSIVETDPNNAGSWKFEPAELTVKAGETVTWTHRGSQQHSVSSDTGAFDSGTMTPGQAWSYQFTAPGEYPYTCTPHPYMTGKVTVT